MSQRKKKSKKHRTTSSKVSTIRTYNSNPVIQSALDAISEKRIGGSTNIKGVNFQLLYSCFRVLDEFKDIDSASEIRMEGIEDIDILEVSRNEFVQLKTSTQTINAGSFWEMGVLQNFYETYKVDQNVSLKLVHDSGLAQGKLTNLESSVEHWKNRFEKDQIDISGCDFRGFLSSIAFQSFPSEEILINECTSILIKDFNISTHATNQFLMALFYNVFIWSKHRKQINRIHLIKVIQKVKDSFSKQAENIAIRDNLIEEIEFESSSTVIEDNGYWEGKAARPHHIAENLPVKRTYWENEIKTQAERFDIVVIKSSSGQGKSTLAWMHTKDKKESGYSIFEITKCNTQQEIAAISDFLISRLKIGLRPLVIIDGLSKQVDNWDKIAQISNQHPISFVVTTREEDWVRYGGDTSKLNLRLINIYLSQEEASDIFRKLKSAKHVHADITSWEPAWEKVAKKKLLIEFVYLLTKGQMIGERVDFQIKQLNREEDCKAKLEILRMVAAADIINLKINTSELISFIEASIGFERDRGEILTQLENEYYLKFKENYVEGLHPVRSDHLFNRLHKSISASDTYLNLFTLLHNEDLYDFGIGVDARVEQDDFYFKLGKSVSQRTFKEMVWVLDGLLHSEPQKFWLENREIFDTVFQNGGLKLFAVETTPFSEVNSLIEFEKTLGDKAPGISQLILLKNQLTKFDLTNSNLGIFAKSLNENISRCNYQGQELEGIGSLFRWYNELNMNLSLSIGNLNEEYLLNLLDYSPIEEVAEVFSYFHLMDKTAYELFVKNHKSKIISYLKVKTNSIVIEEIDQDISIQYLFNDNDASRLNDLSVHRIQMVSSLLPFYHKYHTDVIILPFPNEDIYKVLHQNAYKAMPFKYITDTFKVHLNQIWKNTIEDNYRADSFFDWQKSIYDIRIEAVEFAKRSVRFFEDWLEKKYSRLKTSAVNLDNQASKLGELLRTRQDGPKTTNRHYIDDPLEEEYQIVSGWFSSLNNVVNQYALIINPQGNNDRKVARSNLSDVTTDLNSFQLAVTNIVQSSYQYFRYQDISEDENEWFQRFLKTVEYFVVNVNNSKPIGVAKDIIRYWWQRNQSNELANLNHIIGQFENESYFTFHRPNQILHEGNLKTAVIGVEYIDPDSPDEDILQLLIGLKDLIQLDIDFFDFINVYELKAIGGFRVNKDFLKRIEHTITTGEEFEEMEYGNPIPIIPESKMVEVIDNNIQLATIPSEFNQEFGDTVYDMWKLLEYRRRLDKTSLIEMSWLEEIEKDYMKRIDSSLRKLKGQIPRSEYVHLREIYTNVLENEDVTNAELMIPLNERLNKINEELLI
ncbi:MAG: hypothetical protein AAF363_07435 [Bacteroidota bacterium]